MDGEHQYCTFFLDGHYFGIDVSQVQEVIRYHELTRVPLAATEVAGLLNLRGRIVTVIDMRRRLDFEERAEDGAKRGPLALGIEHKGESYGLLIDHIGEVLKLPAASREGNPVNLDPRLARVSAGVHRLDGRLLVVLDVERVLDATPSAQAA